jgi:hypothetical protein
MNSPDSVEVVTFITYIFFVYLLLAVFVERTVEVLVAVFGYLELKFHWEKFWNTKADRYEERFNRLYAFAGARDAKKSKVLDWILWKVIVDRPNVGGKDIVSADLIRMNYLKIGSRVAAFGISFALVLTQWDTLDVVQIAKLALEKKAVPPVLISPLENLMGLYWFRVILTASLLTIGSEPLHELIKKVEARFERKTKELAGGAQ